MKRGGQEIYVGPLGRHSCHLIKYFEVQNHRMSLNCLVFFRSTYPIAEVFYLYSHQKGIEEVSKIKDGYNPATWMLEVTGPAQELALGFDFADIYRKSDLYK